jgi:predicted Fe-S protein YdhL (DUF1289 family)
MSRAPDDGVVASPCISVCAMDPASGLCAGCYRTLDEIAGWIDLPSAGRRAVIVELATRRHRHGVLPVALDGTHGQR